MAQFWNPAYSCFTFKKVNLVPTMEEYTTLLHYPKIQVCKAYSKATNVPTFVKKLMNITGMNEQWVTARIQQKRDSKCIPWVSLRGLILAHPDVKKKVDTFALCIYGFVVFPKALRHIDEAVADLFDRLDKSVTPVDKVSYRVFSKNYFPLKEEADTQMRDDISEERWMAILQNLKEEDVEWRALWMVLDKILYRCGSFDWVPLLGIWGAVGHAPLLVLRWFSKRINDNIPRLSLEDARSMEEYLQVVPSELEIIRQDF
ncbi:uncharacterized protein [Gossypium hirsutum]|uniref:DUF7745 domain-containing protein n=1 Tax=Gossypium hirsutum TaxID=3635 RepID=A0ABM3BLL6_GOSHI|nr:uncharacterized protein LOC121228967 [Gossypium hirsutum]